MGGFWRNGQCKNKKKDINFCHAMDIHALGHSLGIKATLKIKDFDNLPWQLWFESSTILFNIMHCKAVGSYKFHMKFIWSSDGYAHIIKSKSKN